MKTLKKSLCLVLALVFVLGLCTMGVGATSFTDDAEINYEDAVTVMQGLGILVGYEDGSFQPAKTVTRAEAAKMITYMILGDKYAEKLASGSAFSDVPESHWAAKYVNFCANKGIINGYGNGKFGPSDPVTGIQMAKMLLVACGYGLQGEYVGENWDVNAFTDAVQNGLFEDAETEDFEAAATREETALYVFNTLTGVDQVKWDVDVNKYAYNDDPFGETVWNLNSAYGVIIANQATGSDYTEVALMNASGDYAYTRPTYFAVETGTDLIGHQVKVFFNDSVKKDADKNEYYNSYLADDVSTTYEIGNMKLGELAAAVNFVDTPFDEVPFYANYVMTADTLADTISAAYYFDANTLAKTTNVLSWTKLINEGAFEMIGIKKANGTYDTDSMYFDIDTLVLDEEGELLSCLKTEYVIGEVTETDYESATVEFKGDNAADFEASYTFDLTDCYEGIEEEDLVTVTWAGDVLSVLPTTKVVAEVTEKNVEWASIGWYSFNNSTIWAMKKFETVADDSYHYDLDDGIEIDAIAVGDTIEFYYDAFYNVFAAVKLESATINYAFLTKVYETSTTTMGETYKYAMAQAVDSEGNEVSYCLGLTETTDADLASLADATLLTTPTERLYKVAVATNNDLDRDIAELYEGEANNIYYSTKEYDGTETKIYDTRCYLTDSTNYIYMNGTGTKLDVDLGDVLKTDGTVKVWYTAQKENENLTAVWVYGAKAAMKQADTVIFVKGGSNYVYVNGDDVSLVATAPAMPNGKIDVSGKTYNYFSLYIDGVKTSNVKVAKDSVAAGFYTYSVDSNGIYELDALEQDVDYELVVVDDEDDIYKDKLLVADSALDDYDLNEATIVDLTGGYIDAKGYTKAITSSSAMSGALAQGYTLVVAYMLDTTGKVDVPTGTMYVIYCK